MVHKFDSRSDKQTNHVRILIAGCILIALVLLLPTPAYAAQDFASGDWQSAQTDPTCTPPNDWGQTTRLKVPNKPSKQWSFTVDEPEMMVSLVFFYYQDYSKPGCPYDCSTGECQTDETGNGETPFGGFSVLDGKEGANRGTKQFEGRLAQGTYQVTFTANGNPGSINVGINVRQEAVPTATTPPTKTPTATNTPVTPEPVDTATPTTKPKRTPPATFPPPTPFPGSPPPQILIPQTGFELGQASSVLLMVLVTFGLGIAGLGFTFYGFRKRLK